MSDNKEILKIIERLVREDARNTGMFKQIMEMIDILDARITNLNERITNLNERITALKTTNPKPDDSGE